MTFRQADICKVLKTEVKPKFGTYTEITRILVVKLWVSIERFSFMLVVLMKPNPHSFVHRLLNRNLIYKTLYSSWCNLKFTTKRRSFDANRLMVLKYRLVVFKTVNL